MKQRLLVVVGLAALFGSVLVGHALATVTTRASVAIDGRAPLSTQIRAAVGNLRSGQQLEATATLPDGMVDVRAYGAGGRELAGCVVAPGYTCDPITAGHDGNGSNYSGTIENAPPTRAADLAADALAALRPIGPAHLAVAPARHALRAPGIAGRDVAAPLDERGSRTFTAFYGKVLTIDAGNPTFAVMALTAGVVAPDSIAAKEFLSYRATVVMAGQNPWRLVHASIRHSWNPTDAKLADFAPHESVRIGSFATYPVLSTFTDASSTVGWDGSPLEDIGGARTHPVSFASEAVALSSTRQPDYKWTVNLTPCHIDWEFFTCIPSRG